MPKVELHVHLEGSIRASTLIQLAKHRGVDLPASDEEGLNRWFDFRDFDQFLEVYLTISRCLRDPEDFQVATRAFLEERARENVLYSEVYLTISTHVANGANAQEVADALAETIRESERDLGVTLRWIPDIVRNVEFARADQTLEWALENRDRYVVALGLSGKEDYPSQPFSEHFQVAAQEGLHRAIHAGEQAGPKSIWGALDWCGAERIGHGFRSIEDAALVEALVEREIPLEISPTSNVRLKYVSSIDEHPVKALHRAGVRWSLNSDDPALFDTDLNKEFAIVSEALELDDEAVAKLALEAVDHAFCSEEERVALKKRFRLELEELGVTNRDTL